MFTSGKIYECLNGKRVRMEPHKTYWHGYRTDQPDPHPLAYDAFGQPMSAEAWEDEWGILAVDGKPVEASYLPPDEDWGTDDYKCPHCGSTKGTWFDRSMMMSANGDVLQGMANRCSDCGEDVDAPPQGPLDDGVTAPGYYTVGGIEALDVIKAKLTKEEFRGFLKGSILKYIMRANYKNQHDKDCRKTAFYANRLEQEVADNG